MKAIFEHAMLWGNFLFSALGFALFVVDSDSGEWGEALCFLAMSALNTYVFLLMRKGIREAMQ